MECPEIGKSIGTESRLSVTRGRREWGMEGDCFRVTVPFWVMGKFWNKIVITA